MASKVVELKQGEFWPELEKDSGKKIRDMSPPDFQVMMYGMVRALFAKQHNLKQDVEKKCGDMQKGFEEHDGVIFYLHNRLNHLAEAVCKNG